MQFFSDFEDFANVVNAWLEDRYYNPWRLQELPKSGGRTYVSRAYAVFHNQARLGEIEIEPDMEYSTQNPRVTVHIKLDWVRALDFRTIRDFLAYIARHISEYHRGTLEYLQTNEQIDLVITSVLWETQQIRIPESKSYGKIELELEGLASFYLVRRQKFRDQAAKAKQQT